VERREDLCFHGGDGLTLEMRIFSRKSLLALLAKAGFEVQKVYETSIREYGICLMNYNFVVVAGRPATG